MREKYLNECKIIKDNCEYTAEAHHIIAARNERMSIGFQLVPAIIATLSGILVVGMVVPIWWGWLTVLSAVITAVASILNPLRVYYDHLNAAKNFTALKQEARALKDVFGSDMKDEVFFTAVKNLHDKYNSLIKFVPPTDEKSFNKGRERIKKGVHEPD
jgi:hypothetical protein